MNDETVGYYNDNLMIGNHIIKAFDIMPNSFLDMLEIVQFHYVMVA
jgi:hypothetical protein